MNGQPRLSPRIPPCCLIDRCEVRTSIRQGSGLSEVGYDAADSRISRGGEDVAFGVALRNSIVHCTVVEAFKSTSALGASFFFASLCMAEFRSCKPELPDLGVFYRCCRIW